MVFLHARLYGATALQVVYMALMVYGWYEWRRGGARGATAGLPDAGAMAASASAVAGAAFAVGLGLFLRHRTDAALPFWDAGTTSFSLVAQFMTTRKWLESWLRVDRGGRWSTRGCSSPRSLGVMAALYVAYLVLAVAGFLKWRRSPGRRAGRGGVLTMGADELLRVVLIGPESTGKTRLAGDLAARYGVPWSPEYARTYVEGRVDPLGFADVDPIGRGQKARRGRHRRPGRAASGCPWSSSTPTS